MPFDVSSGISSALLWSINGYIPLPSPFPNLIYVCFLFDDHMLFKIIHVNRQTDKDRILRAAVPVKTLIDIGTHTII
jgi:hypothetical protein